MLDLRGRKGAGGATAALGVGLALAVLGFAACPDQAQAQGKAPLLAPGGGRVVPERYIVVYKRDRGPMTPAVAADRRAAIAAAGGEVGFAFGAALSGVSARLPAAALERVLADPDVAYVEADSVVQLEPAVFGPLAAQTGPPWNLDRADQRTLPLNGAYGYARTGRGVNAYVIDTGLNAAHVEFGGRATRDYDSVGDGRAGLDCNGHGTHVAGTVGGATYGIAKNAKIHGVRVLDCDGIGTASTVLAGIDWVAAHRVLPAVANMSFGASASPAVDEAVAGLIAAGVSVVAAAGNTGENACGVSPARVPDVITVGATTVGDARAYFSNFGPCLDLFAPGVDVASTWFTSSTATEVLSGTSMAAPHVTGVAALYLERVPTASTALVRNGVVNAATVGLVSDEAGSPDRLLYAPMTLPSPQSPSGSVADTTPTFRWGKVYGATRYRFQVVSGGAVLYSKLAGAAVCGAAECARTPAVELAAGNYAWRVQALVNGAWRTWSHRLPFTIQ